MPASAGMTRDGVFYLGNDYYIIVELSFVGVRRVIWLVGVIITIRAPHSRCG